MYSWPRRTETVGEIYSLSEPGARRTAEKHEKQSPPLTLNPVLEQSGDYPLLRMDERRRELQRQEAELFDFGAGDPREPTDERIRQSLIEAVPEVSRYPTVTGERKLREAFCGWMRRRYGVSLNPETEVLPANGSKEAIFHTPFAFLHHSHERRGVAYGTPGYPVYERGATFAGGEPLPVELRREEGFLLPPEAVNPDRTRMAWINYPHNPTGAEASHEYLEKIAAFCREHDILLLSDECYNDIHDSEPPPSVLEATKERTLAFCSLSKRSGMTDYRTAMMAGDAEMISALKKLRPSIGAATPEFVQAAATAAWSDDTHVAERRRIFAEKRELFTSFFQRAGLDFLPTGSSLYLWVAAPDGDDEAYALRLLEEGIVVAPGRAFGLGGEGYIRVALVPPLEECEQALERWERVIGRGEL